MDISKIAASLKPLEVSLDDLYLDIHNPRFIGKDFKVAKSADPLDMKAQERVRKFLVDSFGVDDIIDSIQEVGFLKMDRMVIRPYNDKFIVIEGNRRLSALKTLRGLEDKREVVLPDHVKATIDKIEVLQLDAANGDYQNATWFLQGVRHISGIRDWGAYQQARLVELLMTEYGMSFTDAGKAVGAGRRRAAQMLRGYKGLKQMETDPTFGGKANPDLFSHFEQAWVKAPLRDWLGWDENEMRFTNANALSYFYQWITEENTDTGQKKLTAQQVRDVLPLVISSDEARERFTSNLLTLDAAHGIALVDKQGYKDWHTPIRNAIKLINSIPWAYAVTEEDTALLQDLLNTVKKFAEDKELQLDLA